VIASLISRSARCCSGRQHVEEVRAHLLDVPARRGVEPVEARVGELGELAALVGGARAAVHPPRLLHAGHGVAEPAARGHRVRGQLAHPQPAVRGLGQPHEDLEVGVRQAGVLLQLALDALEEQAVRGEEAAPGVLLLVVEPAGVVHVTFSTK
jgi:hypothetical protein